MHINTQQQKAQMDFRSEWKVFLSQRGYQMVIHIHIHLIHLQMNTQLTDPFSITPLAQQGPDSAPVIFSRKLARKTGCLWTSTASGTGEGGKTEEQPGERDDEARGQAETTPIKTGHPPECEGHVYSERRQRMAKSPVWDWGQRGRLKGLRTQLSSPEKLHRENEEGCKKHSHYLLCISGREAQQPDPTVPPQSHSTPHCEWLWALARPPQSSPGEGRWELGHLRHQPRQLLSEKKPSAQPGLEQLPPKCCKPTKSFSRDNYLSQFYYWGSKTIYLLIQTKCGSPH